MVSQDIKILIVDDEEIYTSVLEHILKPIYTVYTVNSGVKAIEMAKEILPDLILLDVLMPDISGFVVFEELKKHEATRDIAVIFITGMSNTEYEERAFFHGAVDYINKPFVNTIVMARVRIHTQILRQVRTIEQECKIDVLTDLANRRGFEEFFSLEWDKAVRNKDEIVVLFIATEDKNRYIQEYGRSHGYLMTQTVADVLRQTLEQITGFAARWSEETFVVLFPRTKPEGASAIAGIIRSNIKNTVIPCMDGTKLIVSVLMSISSATPTAGDSADAFLEESERKLFESTVASPAPVMLEEPAAHPFVDHMEDGSVCENSFVSKLKQIPLLNAEQAITAMSSSVELYEKVFWLIVKNIPLNIDICRQYIVKKGDLPSFWVKMYELKGALSQIGCRDLAKMTENMEWAAKAGNVKYCEEHYLVFEKQLISFYDHVRVLFPAENMDPQT